MNLRENHEIPSISTNLLSLVQSMDGGGWERFVGIFAPIVYTWCRRSGVSPSDAPDLVQDVFATVARQSHRFQRQKAQDSFRSWLATITRCRVIDHFRKSQKQLTGIGGSDALVMLQQTPDELESHVSSNISWTNSESILVKQVMHQVESEFEPVTWKGFWLTTIESRPAADVSAELGLSIASVYQAKSRVLRRLRTLLSELP